MTFLHKLPPYLCSLIDKTGGDFGPIGKQFAPLNKDLDFKEIKNKDPLEEQRYYVAPGMVYKYKGRVLWTISRFCLAYCSFCTRKRFVGIDNHYKKETKDTLSKKNFLSEKDVELGVNFIKSKIEINEVILSGGDPLVTEKSYLENIINELVQLQKMGQLNFIRIHTRAPIVNPYFIKNWQLDLIKKVNRPFIMLHVNHPNEITQELKTVVNRFIDYCGGRLFSQTVLLKGINDSADILVELFTELVKAGIQPYYLYQNDPVQWANNFTVPLKEGKKIWKTLRPRLSGICATAKFILDTAEGKKETVS